MKYKIITSLPFLWIILIFSSLSPAGYKRNEADNAKVKPNVIIILTDDQGYGDIAAHGNPIIKTPNLDKLSEQSIRFTDFHVAPMCTPTRGELLTGKDAFRNGAVFVTQGKSHVHRNIPTIADVFTSNGYSTGHFGKWHLGDNYPYRPQDRGFQETIHHGAWGITSMVDYWSNDYYDDTYSHNGEYKKYDGYCTDVWFNEAMKWMKQQTSSGDKPFLTYIAINVPHVPLIVDESYIQMFEENVPDDRTQAFFGMITQFDENLGRLEQFLIENGLYENTILIFMTDNGTAGGDEIYNAGMRGKKMSYYEGGHRVPFYIRWPAKGIEGGRNIDELTHSTDLFPTLIELCGLKKTDNIQFDGFDLSGLILGKENKLVDRMKVISYRELNRENSTVLWKKWRLVSYNELYNIEQDPGQQTDVSDQYPDILKAMREYYDSWQMGVAEIDKQVDLISIGTEQEPETFLCSANWTGDYADSWNNIYNEPDKFGYWSLLAESGGRYQISLYRWPKESGRALTDDFFNVNIQHKVQYNKPDTSNPERISSLQVSAARLKINDRQYEKSAGPGATHVSFEVNIQEGQIINLEPVLLDENGAALCGAYFTYVKRIK